MYRNAADRTRRGGAALSATLVVLALAAVVTPVALHVLQRRHDVLAYDVAAEFPAGRTIVPGEALARTVIALVEHELSSPTGWRPNDFPLWGPRVLADNNANRQLGILQVVRETVRVMKDHLTKVSSDEFDKRLADADTAFRNDPRRWVLPAAETRLRDGVLNLRLYAEGLVTEPQQSKRINLRNVELMRLFQAWMDQLGAAHGTLYREPVSFTTSDDEFYFAQGMGHALAHLMPAVWREYQTELQSRVVMASLFDEVTTALRRAGGMKPLIVMSGGEESIFANHRRNLDAFINEARQKMYSIREELEK
jgi:hypothetical protein